MQLEQAVTRVRLAQQARLEQLVKLELLVTWARLARRGQVAIWVVLVRREQLVRLEQAAARVPSAPQERRATLVQLVALV